MFLAYIILRYRDTSEETILKVPKWNGLAYFFGAAGLVTSLLAMAMSLLPPGGTENVILYETKVIGGFLAFVITGGIIYWSKTKAGPIQVD